MTWGCKLCKREFGSRRTGREHFKTIHKAEWKQMRKGNSEFVISDIVGRDI